MGIATNNILATTVVAIIYKPLSIILQENHPRQFITLFKPDKRAGEAGFFLHTRFAMRGLIRDPPPGRQHALSPAASALPRKLAVSSMIVGLVTTVTLISQFGVAAAWLGKRPATSIVQQASKHPANLPVPRPLVTVAHGRAKIIQKSSNRKLNIMGKSRSLPSELPRKSAATSAEKRGAVLVDNYRNVSHALPEPGHAEEYKARLERACNRIRRRDPPTRLVIAGMPNSGTNALTEYLKARLDVTVEAQPPGGIWKHQLPFHPQFEEFLSEECGKSKEQTAVVFTVRNPGTWMLSQTSTGHDFGYRCSVNECVFIGCGIAGTPPCEGVKPPLAFKLPTLLDLWAAYATHLPSSLPTVIVVRYEDLLHDREAALLRVSAHFGVGIKEIEKDAPDPLTNNSRAWFDKKYQSSSGLEESQERMYKFARLWNQYGVVPFGFSEPQRAYGAVSDIRTTKCEEVDGIHLYFGGKNHDALCSATSRGILTAPMKQYKYEIPSPEQVAKAGEACFEMLNKRLSSRVKAARLNLINKALQNKERRLGKDSVKVGQG